MKLKVINEDFSICKVKEISDINLNAQYCFVGKTDEEISVVCSINDIPKNVVARDDEWKAFKIEGVLDFSLIGILSKISQILAENKIGIFAISTYNTDYILTKKENFLKALEVLNEAGYEIIK